MFFVGVENDCLESGSKLAWFWCWRAFEIDLFIERGSKLTCFFVGGVGIDLVLV